MLFVSETAQKKKRDLILDFFRLLEKGIGLREFLLLGRMRGKNPPRSSRFASYATPFPGNFSWKNPGPRFFRGEV
ncbi:hypothetical protein A0128_06595 [Leptospira tipperaryensis]|uniref:Uncharacterized protein n=1 Tax=Leptospira tipperaryensis TaxID=2564040 RepID=A0A1D7UVI7_9LEPT|nr:hypothetical protein A0128_06595 [Leptospira tipperaryensis]